MANRKSKFPHYLDGEVFELTLDFDAPKNQPMEMVRRDGYGSGWQHNGSMVKGTQTRRFKWVEVGCCRGLDEVREKLAPPPRQDPPRPVARGGQGEVSA